jgi:hypothetical protein
MNGSSRYHAEIKVGLAGRECRINIFADTLNEVFKDLGTIVAQLPDSTYASEASRELANASNLARARTAAAPAAPAARTPATAARPIVTAASPNEGELPTCQECGQWDGMELIEFTDKKTGEVRRAWKCQTCKKWYYPPNGKGK